MKTKKITLLLMLAVISLLTIFLVVLLDDSVLAADDPGSRGEQILTCRILIWRA